MANVSTNIAILGFKVNSFCPPATSDAIFIIFFKLFVPKEVNTIGFVVLLIIASK